MRDDRSATHGRESRRHDGARNGAVTLELLLVIPINMIILIAVAQFTFFLSNDQQLVLACRTGAGLAAESNLPPQGNPIPPHIVDAVARQLASSGIEPCAIILEHIGSGGAHTEQTLRTNCTAAGVACQEPSNAIPPNSVRLTVCVPLAEMMPNAMSGFGFDISGNTAKCSTTFGSE